MSDDSYTQKKQEIQKVLEEERTAGRLSQEEAREIEEVISEDKRDQLAAHEKEESELAKQKEGDIRSQLRDMKLPQKMKLAMFGNSVCRSLLIFDANRLVQEAVLKNPQLQVAEVEGFVKNSSCPEYVLRSVSNSKTWMKSYLIKLNFVLNPKSPPDLSLKWLSHLRHADLKRVAISKNIPQVVATTAKKRAAEQGK